MSPETLAKMRAAALRQGSPSVETRAKISAKLRGRPQPANAGTRNGNWRGETITYTAAHLRARASLAGSVCGECGSPRFEAALIHGRGQLQDSAGRWYSPDPKDYEARCHRCHHKYDHAMAPRQQGRFIATEEAVSRRF